jgi:hypothetical protein
MLKSGAYGQLEICQPSALFERQEGPATATGATDMPGTLRTVRGSTTIRALWG